MPSGYIDIKSSDETGEFKAYFTSRPYLSDLPRPPGIVIIQEIFGISPFLKEMANRYAAHGFAVVVPDLFWRQGSSLTELPDQSEVATNKAFELYQKFDVEKGVDDIAASLRWLRENENTSGKTAVVGYCLGGLLAFLSGCQLDIDAAIGYYGVGIEKNLTHKNMIRKPMMLHFAENDGFVPEATRKELEESFIGNDLVSIHNYGGCDHGFARTGGQNYDKAAAEISDTRTLALLKKSLA
jgi:carboxymethylenebutenolidase